MRSPGPRGPITIDCPLNDPQINRGSRPPVLLCWCWTKGVFSAIFPCLIMDETDNSSMNSGVAPGAENSDQVSFGEAARFLGLDTFTFYALVQREEIPSVLAPNGEFVVSQDDLDRFAAKE